MTTTNCCVCGVVFGVPDFFLEARRKDKKTFYCPNGHNLSYTESSQDVKIRELERKNTQLVEEKDRLSGELARPWRCPHCTRRYVERYGLIRHVESTHGRKAALALPENAGDDAHGDMGVGPGRKVVPIRG
jgi:uncharacterized C2H2 Zn-finger protein